MKSHTWGADQINNMPLDRTAMQKLAKHHCTVLPYGQYVKTLKKLKEKANREQWLQKYHNQRKMK